MAGGIRMVESHGHSPVLVGHLHMGGEVEGQADFVDSDIYALTMANGSICRSVPCQSARGISRAQQYVSTSVRLT